MIPVTSLSGILISVFQKLLKVACAVTVLLNSAAAQTTTRASVNTSGAESHGPSERPSISADGWLIAFSSSADNLVGSDTNAMVDIFVRNDQTGTTVRVSVNSAGGQANGDSSNPSISADGRYIAYESLASNLVSGVSGGQVYVHDLSTGVTTCASVNTGGVQGNLRSRRPAISASGQYIAFQSDATNLDLMAVDTNNAEDVFLHDRIAGKTTRISVVTGGGQSNRGGNSPSVSDDGRYCAFQSASSDLFPNDHNNKTDIFLHDSWMRETTAVSLNTLGYGSNGHSYYSAISQDGRSVAFFSEASDLISNDTNGASDVFVWDRLLKTTSSASLTPNGIQGNFSSFYPSISGDGRYVGFISRASNLVNGDTNNADDVFLRDLLLGSTVRVNVSTQGVQANGGNYGTSSAAVSAFGRRVAFSSEASNLVSGDSNGEVDVFLHVLPGQNLTLELIGVCPGPIRIRVRHATSNGRIAILYGNVGAFIKTSPPCQGTTLGIFPPRLGAIILANGIGTADLSVNATSAFCGYSVQAVDMSTCIPTNIVLL